MNIAEDGFTLKVDSGEAAALRAWLAVSPEALILPDPRAVLAMNGAADVSMEDDGQCISFHVSVDNVDPADARDVAASLLRAICDDAVRLHQWVPDFRSPFSQTLVFWDDILKTNRKRITGKLVYSDPDFIIVSAINDTCVSACYRGESPSQFGSMLWNKRTIRSLKLMTEAYGEHSRFTEYGLPARGIPEIIPFALTAFGAIPAIVEKMREENAIRLAGHHLASSVEPTFELIYVDADLIFARNWAFDVYWLYYRREGLPEKRMYQTAEGRRHAKRAAAAMNPTAQPGNPFRKWVEKQGYGFDVAVERVAEATS